MHYCYIFMYYLDRFDVEMVLSQWHLGHKLLTKTDLILFSCATIVGGLIQSCRAKLTCGFLVHHLCTYDIRYYRPFSHLQIMSWNNSIKYTLKSGCIAIINTFKPLHRVTIKYSDYLESKYPGYLRSLYWYVTRTLEVKDNFAALVITTN